MAIFNSYVKLPEGNTYDICDHQENCPWDPCAQAPIAQAAEHTEISAGPVQEAKAEGGVHWCKVMPPHWKKYCRF
jgi:hypothetical protein